MKNRSRLAAAILTAVLLLSACGNPEPADSTAGGSESSLATTGAPLSSAPGGDTTSAAPIEPPQVSAGSVAIDEHTWKIDTSYFVHNQLTIDRVLACDDEKLLFFASRLNLDGTVSEQSVACVYSLSTDRFCTQTLELGTVAIYPDSVHDDGTVSVVTMDSESYEFNRILFLDPAQMTAQEVSLPTQNDLVSLSVSPNKQYCAQTTYTGVRVTDLGFETEYLSVGARAEQDTELTPTVTAWSKDSAYLTLRLSDAEEVYYPALAHISSGKVDYLTALVQQEARVVGDRLFCNQWYPYLPCGFARLDGSGFTAIALEDEAASAAEVSQIAVSGGGSFLGAAYLKQENESPVACCGLIADVATGKTVHLLSFEDFSSGAYSFESISFTPDQRTAIFSTTSTLTRQKEVFVVDFGR